MRCVSWTHVRGKPVSQWTDASCELPHRRADSDRSLGCRLARVVSHLEEAQAGIVSDYSVIALKQKQGAPVARPALPLFVF